MAPQSNAAEALDRVLALRPDDLDGWEPALVASLPAEEREAEEAADAEFAALLGAWTELGQALPEPSLTAADVLRLDRPRPAAPAPRRVEPSLRVRAFAFAAALAIGAGAWVAIQWPDDAEDGFRPKSLVSDAVQTRVELQFAVERSDSGAVAVFPGRSGATYGPRDALAMRLDVRGEGGFLTLFEVDPEGDAHRLYPLDAAPLRLEAGAHPLVGSSGRPLVYRPDEGVTGERRYVAVLTDEPVDAERVLAGLLAAGTDRPDLWPRPVRAASEFAVHWE